MLFSYKYRWFSDIALVFIMPDDEILLRRSVTTMVLTLHQVKLNVMAQHALTKGMIKASRGGKIRKIKNEP